MITYGTNITLSRNTVDRLTNGVIKQEGLQTDVN
jgi:hypothetical protein